MYQFFCISFSVYFFSILIIEEDVTFSILSRLSPSLLIFYLLILVILVSQPFGDTPIEVSYLLQSFQ